MQCDTTMLPCYRALFTGDLGVCLGNCPFSSPPSPPLSSLLLPSPPFSSPPLPSPPLPSLPSSHCVQVLYQLLHSTDLCVVQCSLCCLIQFAKGGEGQTLVEVQGEGEVHLLFHMVQEFDTTTQQ